MIKHIHINLGLISAIALIAGDLLVSSAFSAASEKTLSNDDPALRKKEAVLVVHGRNRVTSQLISLTM